MALGDASFRSPEIPVVANVDARVHSDPAEWPGLLSAQLCSPVRWRQSLETLGNLGGTTFVELGPGGVLSGLARRSLQDIETVSVAEPDDLDRLMDLVARPEGHAAETPTHIGEHLYMSERIVVSPGGGIFFPEQTLAAPGTGLLPGTGATGGPTSVIAVGDLIGRVGAVEVHTPFAGEVIRWQAAAGERVQEGQALLWLRVSGEDG
jgi:[acyl-carrier-protein] S-malonyltransferase